MKMLGIVGIISAAGFFAAAPATGHECHHNQHWSDCSDSGHYSCPHRIANRGAVALQTLEGKIAEVVYLPGATEDSGLVEVRLQSTAQGQLIRLAPTAFLKENGFLLKEGDSVTVKGFPVNGMEGHLLVATEIRKGDKSLSLRDASGQPAW